MTNVMTNRGWLAAFAAAILCLAAFGLASTAQAAGSATALTVGSATTAPNTDVTIHVTVSGSAIGADGVNVAYNSALVSPTACTSAFGVCNTASPTLANAVYINGSSLAGITGTNVDLGTITFHAGSTTGTAALTATIVTLADTDGTNLTVTPTNGSIVIAEATASPTASPTTAATATPVVTPKVIVNTGGPPGDSSSISLAWLLGAAGLMVVAGGAWTLARARREEN